MSDAMSFTPRFPWNDDERDTSSFIEYYSHNAEIQEQEEEYVPTYVIMKEYFQEQRYDASVLYDTDDYNIYYECEDDMYSDGFSTLSGNESLDDITVDDILPKTGDKEDGDNEENASSPYVSNKYWYM